MNIEIANRLVELRKKSGLSQEELAEKLGLSRQAVSKWERAEASPDTDNLICLAKLYGVSLDDLLNTDQPVEEIVEQLKEKQAEEKKQKEEKETVDAEVVDDEKTSTRDKKDSVHVGFDGIHVVDGEDGDEVHIDRHGIHVKDGKSGDTVNVGRGHYYHKKESVLATIFSTGTFVLLATIAYIVMGILWEGGFGWAWGWTLILDAICLGSLVNCFVERRICSFAYPILMTSLYCTFSFFNVGGLSWGFWWFLFITIPVFYMIFGPIDGKLHHKKHNWRDDAIDNEDEKDEK